MSYRNAPMSLAQIHNVYAPSAKTEEKTPAGTQEVYYARTSFAGRAPGHPGSPPPLPESKGKKSRR